MVQDPSGATDTGSVNLNVTPVNDPPVAVDDGTVATPLPIVEDTPTVLNLLGNDTDVDGDTLSIKSINGTAITPGTAQTITVPNGTVTVSATGVVSFTPALNYNGPITFDYVVQDPSGATDTGSVNLNVTPVNDPPVAIPVNAVGNEDAPIALNLTGSDLDGTVTSVTITTLPPATQGILTKADGTPVVAGVPLTPAEAAGLIFVPAPNFNGSVVIPFTVTDNEGGISTPANVAITINAVNDPPIATPIAPTGNEDTPIPVNLTGTDVEGPIASVTVTSLPPATQGILTKADGTPVVAGVPLTPLEAAGLIFVPAPNFNGSVVIPFTVTDNQGVVSPPANASITVLAVNDPPVAIAASGNAVEDTPSTVNLRGTDVDGTIASVTVTTLPDPLQGILTKADGTPVVAGVPLSPAEAASLIFRPALNFNGIVNIPFTVKDNSGASSAPANFILDVGSVDDDPIATPTVVNTPEDTPVAVSLTGTDVEGPITAVTVVSLPPASQGILVKADGTPVVAGVPLTPLEAAGLIFKPAPNFNGAVNIPFTVTDSVGQISSPPASLTLNISPVNDPPVAIPSSPSGNEDTPITLNLTGTDIDGTIASVTVTTLPPASQGVLKLADGTPVAPGQVLTPAQAASLVFVPAHNFVGTVNIPFTVTDNSGARSAPATTVISVKDVVSPPTASPLVTGGTTEDKIPVNLGGTDADGTITSVTIKAIPLVTQGVLTLADGTPVTAGQVLTPAQAAGLIFKPNSSFNGTATILFTVTDDEGLESSIAGATVKITEIGGLFEQLLSQPNGINNLDPNRPDPFAIHTPVIPIGMPEDLFVSHSVRESQNQIAQNSNFGVFNVDAPTANELNNFTFDLKGLQRGMDSNLFVQNAVRGSTVTFEPNLFVQNAVRQSALESTARNIGVASFNSATPGVSDLFSPFEIGSPMQFVSSEIAPPVAELSPIKSANRDIAFKDSTVDKQKINKECIPLKMQTRDYTQTHAHKPYLLKAKPATERLQPASSFTKQLTHAKHKSSTNVFCKH